jgi:hypothetical protein
MVAEIRYPNLMPRDSRNQAMDLIDLPKSVMDVGAPELPFNTQLE